MRALLMPEAAHDRGFAMTSSFSAMLVAGALAFRLWATARRRRLALAAAELLRPATELAGRLVRADSSASYTSAATSCAGSRRGGPEAPRADRRPRRGRLRLDARLSATGPRPSSTPGRSSSSCCRTPPTRGPTTAICCGNWSGKGAPADSWRLAVGRMASAASRSLSSPAWMSAGFDSRPCWSSLRSAMRSRSRSRSD